MTKSRNIRGPRRPTVIGQRVNGLTLIRLTVEHVQRRCRKWLCRCDCGVVVDVPETGLSSGKRKSCGCMNQSRAGVNSASYKHGYAPKNTKRRPPEYAVWRSLKDRCYNPNEIGYHNYGGRGIQVCERWRNSFVTFLEDVGPRPSPKHSIDRIDNDGNYEPGNVRWATRVEQNRNTRRTRFLTQGNVTLSIRGWEDRLGFNEGTLQSRLDRGWPVEEVLAKPLNPPRRSRGV